MAAVTSCEKANFSNDDGDGNEKVKKVSGRRVRWPVGTSCMKR